MMNYYGDDMRWFVGTVANNLDPIRVGRVQVRIHGIHSSQEGQVPTYDLPWAQVVLPTTEGGTSGIGRNPMLQPGAQVIGFFLDGKTSQNPIILGSIPSIEIVSPIQRAQAGDAAQQIGFPSGSISADETRIEGDVYADPNKQRQLTSQGSPQYPPDCNPAWITSVITREAERRYMDPTVCIAVAKSEGMYSYQSKAPPGTNLGYNGREASFGPYQLYIGGRGVGKSYGSKVAGDPTGRVLLTDNNRAGITKQIQFALDTVIKNRSWAWWHGWKGAPDAGLDYRGISKPRDFQ